MANMPLLDPKENYLDFIFSYCKIQSGGIVWYIVDISVLITGIGANATLLWSFLKETKPLSASKVLGMNLVVMDLVFLSLMPFVFVFDFLEDIHSNRNESELSINEHNSSDKYPVQGMSVIFSNLILIGCPLLLACMCIERNLAVTRPVLYLRVRRRENYKAVSAVVWVITLAFCLTTGMVDNITIMIMTVSIIISSLFFIMLACLGGVVWSLWQHNPAHTADGNQARFNSPIKRQAVGNVVFVLVSAVVSYLPVLMMVSMMTFIVYFGKPLNRSLCNFYQSSLLFPRLGVFIGPLFYFSRVRQACCLRGARKIRNT
ncbi:uncharacterized protein ACBR49_010836 [Aulostomus maculatus]